MAGKKIPKVDIVGGQFGNTHVYEDGVEVPFVKSIKWEVNPSGSLVEITTLRRPGSINISLENTPGEVQKTLLSDRILELEEELKVYKSVR